MNKINPTTTFVSKICCTILMLLSAFPVLANESGDANKEVSGVVVDKKTKDPLIGVNVAIWKDGTIETGVTTDFDGAFHITTSLSDFEVQISYMGYKDLKFSSKSQDLSAMLVELEEDANTLGDVVVTGFVTKNKETFTGSVTEMSGLELRQVSGTNLIGAISALTPGMAMVQNTAEGSNPNHTPELVLRGMSSFSNSGQQVNQPTIILD
jgi:hypothetical protein